MSDDKEMDFEEKYNSDDDDKYMPGKSFYDFISDCATFAGIIYFLLLIVAGALGGWNLGKILTQNDAFPIVFGFLGILSGFVLAVITLSPIAILRQIRDSLSDKEE